MHAGVVIPLVAVGATYAVGARHTHRGAAYFTAGWIVLAFALLGPLHHASEEIFTAHMIQHELLMVVAAPLLVLSRPGAVMLWAFGAPARSQIANIVRLPALRHAWSTISRPAHAWLFHGVVIWVWHLPPLFQATLHSELAHAAQHVSFVASALVFWWSIVHRARRERGTAIVSLFTTTVHTGVLGALMTFARQPWYPDYASSAAAWGLTPMGDQQLAGLVMWVPASFAYLVAALVTMRRWMNDSEEAVAASERLTQAA
jgi:cytochrome c oxidase assembly factor CtaG